MYSNIKQMYIQYCVLQYRYINALQLLDCTFLESKSFHIHKCAPHSALLGQTVQHGNIRAYHRHLYNRLELIKVTLRQLTAVLSLTGAWVFITRGVCNVLVMCVCVCACVYFALQVTTTIQRTFRNRSYYRNDKYRYVLAVCCLLIITTIKRSPKPIKLILLQLFALYTQRSVESVK